MKSTRSVLAAVIASAAAFVALPASASFAGGGGGGTVAGPCGTFTSISASSVTLSASGSGYTASPLQLRGEVSNCSTFLQQYWIDFAEPTNTNPNCKASFSLFNALLLSSGSRQGWTASTNITPTPVASATGCVGPHTVQAILRSRTDGTALSTVTVSYTVTAR
jgi:hypothetical protein